MKKKSQNQMSTKEVVAVNIRSFRLLYCLQPYAMVAGILLSVWNALTPYVGISFSAQILDELTTAHNPQRLWYLVLCTLGASAFISLINTLLKRWHKAEDEKMWSSFRHLLVTKNLDMDYVRIDDPETHKLFHTIEQNENGGGWGLIQIKQNVTSIISEVFSMLGGIVLTVSLFSNRIPKSAGTWTFLDNPLFIACFLTLLIAVPCISAVVRNHANSYYARNAANHNLSNRLYSWCSIGYQKKSAANMRMYRIDKICDAHILDKTDLFRSNGYFANLNRGIVGYLRIISGSVSQVFTLLIYLYVCLKAWTGAFGIGGITQYISAVSKISGSVGNFLHIWGDIRNNTPFVKLIFQYLDLPNEMYQGSLTTEKRVDNDYEIEFRNVSFRYPGSETYALKNVSIKFRIGQCLAVVGPNGSGKTTFVKLLCRLYDPTEGQILLNNIDIRKYDYEQYMGIFAVVFQDFKLFPFKIGQNVAAAEQYDKEKVTDCLIKAGFGERLGELKDGLETYLYKEYKDEGINISGGEAQKIALARALYKNSPFIILDEPTAALDPIAEAEIYSKFNEIVGKRTAIYISHRLSSCRFCDTIAVFEEGSVVQTGSHEKLLAENGLYQELWNAQAQYYQ